MPSKTHRRALQRNGLFHYCGLQTGLLTTQRLQLVRNRFHLLQLLLQLPPLLLRRLPSITFLDDEALRPSVAPTSLTNRDINRQLLHRREADDQRTDLTGPLGPGGLDSMEREYLAALKGEKDNTVIS